MNILQHERKHVGTTGLCLHHTVLLETAAAPDIAVVADVCGYHPLGYDMVGERIETVETGKYRITWFSSPQLL
ncbi:hypothetical protein [Paenibacillus sp. HB172176]|uniref:hypothetical protein n=1 Tax=Paenibacillus sp. HB172176 TaxID=2493690 RepID=UPI00143B24C0|nr:hypothetical protein [Paenibacillus sp. HB172176]